MSFNYSLRLLKETRQPKVSAAEKICNKKTTQKLHMMIILIILIHCNLVECGLQ